MDLQAKRIETDKTLLRIRKWWWVERATRLCSTNKLTSRHRWHLTRPEISVQFIGLIGPQCEKYLHHPYGPIENFSFRSFLLMNNEQIPGDTKVRAWQAPQPPCPRSSLLE